MQHVSMWNALAASDFSVSHEQIGGYDTRILQIGQAGPPLVLMHGVGGHLEAYMHNLAVLAEQFRVIAFDFPGHGYSQLATTPLETSSYVAHLLALLDHFGIDRASLNGESLGGWVAVKFAAAYPDRVQSLVLNTPGGTMANPEVMNRIRTLSQGAADDPSEANIRARLEWLMADNATVTTELVETRRRIYSRPGFPESMRNIMVMQDPEIRQRNLITDEELVAINVPTLVIWTSNDPSGPASAGMHMADTIPGGRFYYIEDAGHWPQWEQRDVFNDVVRNFLDESWAGVTT